jgi:predicted metalloendopeptidase
MNSRTAFIALALAVALAAAGGRVIAEQGALKSGLDPAQFDKTVRPQDDLFRYVNGGWLAKTEIPADRPVYGTFVQLDERAEADLYALIEELAGSRDKKPGSTAQQVGDFYSGFISEAKVNALGAEPLKPRLAEIDRIKGHARTGRDDRPVVHDWPTRPRGRFHRSGCRRSHEGRAVPGAGRHGAAGSRLLPECRCEVRGHSGEVRRVPHKDVHARGTSRAAEDAKAVMDLETALAKIQWTQVESRDAVKTYNKYPLTKVVADMPGFDWMAWARPQGIDKTDWIINQPSFFTGFAAMVPTTPLETWKAWLAAQVIGMDAPYLSDPFVEARFEFFGKTLSGQQQQRPRWKRGVQLVNGAMGEALGQLYVAKHFPAASKTRMEKMIANLIEAYRQSITELEWMTPATRKEALDKLAKFSPKIAYPPKWRDYTALQVKADDLIGNVERANRLENEYQVGKLGRPVDRDAWLMTPQTVNAYYNPVKNEIVFPAAILQPPFFDVTADDAVNYGSIGAVIGHEIGHGFDDQGRRFDGEGKLRDWWKPEDEVEFQKRAKLLVEQFNGFTPLPDMHVNGELTLGETSAIWAACRLPTRRGRFRSRARRRRCWTVSPATSASSWVGRRHGAPRRAKNICAGKCWPIRTRGRNTARTGRSATSRRSTTRSASSRETSCFWRLRSASKSGRSALLLFGHDPEQILPVAVLGERFRQGPRVPSP